MSTPSDPTTPTGPPVPAPATPLASSADQIRQLATQLNQPPYNFDPANIRKAIITAIDAGNSTTAPTCTILFSGDTTSPVAGVRLAAGYGPQVGDTCIVLKSGADFFMLTDIVGVSNQTASSTAGGWTKATLQGSHSHNGNSNGDVMYRRTMDGGCWKMQWKGALNYGGNTALLGAALGVDFRPPTKVSILAPRDVNNGGATSVQLDIQTDGTISIIATNWSTNSVSSHTHDVSGFTGGHSHTEHDGFGTTGSSDSWGNNTTNSGGHSHTASNPSWIGLHGLEYFLG